MNSNQSRNLTPKQQELVQRLEDIRSNKNTKQAQTNQKSTNRNRNQNQRKMTNSRETVSKERTRTASQKKFARPVSESPVRAKRSAPTKPSSSYKPRYTRPTQNIQRAQPKSPKEAGNYINKLSNGKKLSQAIILSEILDKPLALRKRR